MNVKEAARLAGTSVRTLHYYEEKGLIQPFRRNGNAYRDYDPATIGRVRLIRGYRELQFSLEQIRQLLELSWAERDKILQAQIDMLEKRKREIEHRIALVRGIRMLGPERLGEIDFAALDSQMEKAQRILDENEEVKKHSERFRAQSKQQSERMQEELLKHLAEVANTSQDMAMEAIGKLKGFVEESFYPCTKETLLVYGRAYGGSGLLAQALEEVAGEGAAKRLRMRIEEWFAGQD